MTTTKQVYITDSHKRSWAKSITWRITAFFVLGTLSWVVTHNWAQTSVITTIYNLIQVVLYYVHERIWQKTSWGSKKVPPEDYTI